MAQIAKPIEKPASESTVIATSQTAPIAQISPPSDAPRLALNYCRLGATDAQLAEFFDVSPETLGGWLADSREFAAAVRRGRKMADAEVVDSLHQLATGYVETVEKVMVCHGEPMVVTYRKQHRPDRKAGMTWLSNRMPQDWKLPGTKREEKSVADAVDLFALPLLIDEDLAIDDRHPERSRPQDGAVEGPPLVDATAEQVPPLRLVPLASGRDDECEELPECALGLPPPPERVLAAA
jgi:hypothetical protein